MKTILLLGTVLALVPASPAWSATIWAVGDGANPNGNDDAVANLIVNRGADDFLYLGDVYDSGSATEYATNYQTGFGQLKAITRPAPGNHEWAKRAEGYDAYWGPTYAQPHYYSFDRDGWHLISLNSEEPFDEGSAQLSWLRADLAAHPGNCTLAYWHRPRFSAGSHGDQIDTDPLWRELAGHATIVLAGHDHNYQRFKPIDGITEFVVGTGGKGFYVPSALDTRLAATRWDSYGALRLLLAPGQATFSFETVGGASFDSGSIGCSTPAASPSTPATRPRLVVGRRHLRLGRHARKLRLEIELSVPGSVHMTTRQRRARGRYGKPKSKTIAMGRGQGVITLRRKRLRPGLHRITLVVTDGAGERSDPVVVKLRVLR